MKNTLIYRPATPADSRFIARMIALSSDGIASLEWRQACDETQGETPLDVGSKTYAQDDGDYSYRNGLIAEIDHPVGIILSFPITVDNYSANAKPPPYQADEVFAPYAYLEALNSWYICGVAVIPEYRRQGIAKRLIELSMEQGRLQGFSNVSLIAMAEKRPLIAFYQSLGFKITRSAPVVAHPHITAKGMAVLMETHPAGEVESAIHPREKHVDAL